MNLIHLRSTTNAKNPGAHPIGSIGAVMDSDATDCILFTGCATAHGDQFSKAVARNILAGRLTKARFTSRLTSEKASIKELAAELGIIQPLRKRLSKHDWEKAQKVLDNMILDLAMDTLSPKHCPKCASERGVAIPAKCSHKPKKKA
jgi:hypothetical protein